MLPNGRCCGEPRRAGRGRTGRTPTPRCGSVKRPESAAGHRPLAQHDVGLVVHRRPERAVLHVQMGDPVAVGLEQVERTAAAGDRPVGVDFERHPGVEQRHEVVVGRHPVNLGRHELELVVVIADRHAGVGKLPDLGVDGRRNRGDALARQPGAAVGAGLKHRVDAQRSGRRQHLAGGADHVGVRTAGAQAVLGERAGQPVEVLDAERFDLVQAHGGDGGERGVAIAVEQVTQRVQLQAQPRHQALSPSRNSRLVSMASNRSPLKWSNSTIAYSSPGSAAMACASGTTPSPAGTWSAGG